MKFPRNARIFKGQIDVAPLASVFFLLIIFVMLGSLVYTPGVRMHIELPQADGLAGVSGPTVAMAVDAGGQFFFENQTITEEKLEERLLSAVSNAPAPLTLVVLADKAVNQETLDRVAMVAQRAGIRDLLRATLSRGVQSRPADAPTTP